MNILKRSPAVYGEGERNGPRSSAQHRRVGHVLHLHDAALVIKVSCNERDDLGHVREVGVGDIQDLSSWTFGNDPGQCGNVAGLTVELDSGIGLGSSGKPFCIASSSVRPASSR